MFSTSIEPHIIAEAQAARKAITIAKKKGKRQHDEISTHSDDSDTKIPKKKYKQSIYKSNYRNNEQNRNHRNNEKNRNHRNNEQNRNDGCYKCGSTDHDRKDCPRKRTFCKICAELEDVTKRERRMYTHNTEAHDDKMPTRNTGFERYCQHGSTHDEIRQVCRRDGLMR
eukprot:840907_1